MPVERIAVDLDDPTGTPLLVPEDGENIKPYLDARSLTLDRGEEIGLELTAYSEEFHYQWEIELHIAYGDVEHESYHSLRWHFQWSTVRHGGLGR